MSKFQDAMDASWNYTISHFDNGRRAIGRCKSCNKFFKWPTPYGTGRCPHCKKPFYPWINS